MTDTQDPGPTTRPGRRPRGFDRLVDRFVVSGRVTEAEPIAARMRRVRIAGDELRALTCLPGQQVRVLTGDPEGDSFRARLGDLRTYSVWHFDADAGELDLCVMDHGDGPGARWGRTAEPGQAVRFRAPEGSFTVRPEAAYHVLIGEETASVAFGAMLAALPDTARVYGAIETADPEDRLPLARASELSRPLRGTASAESSAVLLNAVRALDLPGEPGIAYVGGEAKTIQLVRGHLTRDRGWPRRSVLTKPFWTPGKTGMD